MKKLLLFVFILIGFNSFSQKKPDLKTTLENLRKLMLDPSASGLTDISHPSLTYGHSSGKVENQKEFIEALVSGASDFTSLTFSDVDIYQTKNSAIVRHILEGETSDKGKQPGKVKIKVMLVWVLEKGQWKLFGRQAVKI
ncbi:MAG: nuclear transport factor 2 family protein [Cytophagaceae bacterium]|nr:nuclear transport factor 2 family protein [Cytophagaceae bacterium]MBK9511934.1 nuclear transport factor 2 family protein [Cytophagaceae bacterium]MBK9934877.1 nuclear transport factor 2 family protein [Cytophagaceae bacterium]MBL0301315.1 nuclear transport factor 2 family protein [Cytophagaceae bacterium]MBL0324133.1 nuclear transport factor 2 family protein [Cytophagaceae bacterium]